METALPPRPSAAPRQLPPDPPTRPPAPQTFPQVGAFRKPAILVAEAVKSVAFFP